MLRRIVILFCTFFLFSIMSRPVSADLSLPVSADALTYSLLPTVPLGTQPQLLTEFSYAAPPVDSFDDTARTYLQFDLSGLTGDVPAATELQLYVQGAAAGSEGNLALYATSDAWTESGIIWDTHPAAGGLLDSQPAPTTSGGAFTFSGAALVSHINIERTGDGIVSFVIMWEPFGSPPPSDNTFFTAQEGVAGLPGSFAPVLLEPPPTAIQLGGLAINSSAVSTPLIATVLAGLVLTGLSALQTARRRRQLTSLT